MPQPITKDAAGEPLDLPGETWKDFPDQPAYEVSDLGRVRRKAVIIKGTLHKNGYRAVAFYSTGVARQKKVAVHRAVATAFHGDGGDLYVAHLNGCPSDNRAENLTWATQRENMFHRWNHDTVPYGERSPNSKLTENQVREIRRRAAEGLTPTQMKADYPVSREVIRDIVYRKTWKYLAD